MKVLLASPRGFCAGVERAIEVVERALEAFGPPVYVRKEIVHNRFVVEDLKSRGAVFVEELAEVPEGSTVIFSAHGISPTVRDEAKTRKLKAIDATCPLVTKVHLEVARFLGAGCDLILVGHAGHDEVVGTMGEAPGRIQLVTSVDDAARVEVANPEKLVVLTQTTLSADDSAVIMAALRRRFPKLSLPSSEDICYATRSRQQAVRALARWAPVILVVGAQNSSNSIRLTEVAKDARARAFLLNHVGDVDWSWLNGVETVGITAGASAPERVVRELINTILFRYGGELEEVSSVPETTRFFLPPELEEALKAGRSRTTPREAVASRKD